MFLQVLRAKAYQPYKNIAQGFAYINTCSTIYRALQISTNESYHIKSEYRHSQL